MAILKEWVISESDLGCDGSYLSHEEIVRCRDCKYKEDEEHGMVYCPNQKGGWVREDFFCADGERRTDND